MEHTVHGLSMGSVLINSWLAIALSGIMLLQAYMYYRSKPETDRKIFGLLVVALLLLDMAHVVCIMSTLYHYLISNFGNNEELAILVPPLALTVGLTGTITFFAQSFFTWRVWRLSQKNIIAPVIFVFQVARLVSGWVTTVKAIEFGTFVAWTHQVRWIFTAGLTIAVLCDILITGSLCYWLHESRSGVHGMNEIIDKIILYSIENGALICLASIASLICGIIMPGNLVFIGIHFVISKLYINSVLASLNTRNLFRAHKERMFLNAHAPGDDRLDSVRQQQQQNRSGLSAYGYALQSPKSPRSFRSSELTASVKEREDLEMPTADFVIRAQHIA